MILEKQIENYLRAEPTRRFPTKDIAVRFGRTRAVTAILKKIRGGLIPNLHFVVSGRRYEYFYVPEGFFVDPPVLTYREFLESGYLQEVNRQFFHPLGLSLALVGDDTPGLIIYDFRNKVSGVSFSPDVVRNPKFKERLENVGLEYAEKLLKRQVMLGFGELTTKKAKVRGQPKCPQ